MLGLRAIEFTRLLVKCKILLDVHRGGWPKACGLTTDKALLTALLALLGDWQHRLPVDGVVSDI